MTDKILNIAIGLIIAAAIWYFLLPLLTGVVHTIAAILIVVVVILWLMRVAGMIS